MLCYFCGSETKEWVKIGNVYVIIHHFCKKQAEEDNVNINVNVINNLRQRRHQSD